jgi:hypothetical protein
MCTLIFNEIGKFTTVTHDILRAVIHVKTAANWNERNDDPHVLFAARIQPAIETVTLFRSRTLIHDGVARDVLNDVRLADDDPTHWVIGTPKLRRATTPRISKQISHRTNMRYRVGTNTIFATM